MQILRQSDHLRLLDNAAITVVTNARLQLQQCLLVRHAWLVLLETALPVLAVSSPLNCLR